MSQLPKVGVTVLVVKDGKILLGKRKGDLIGTDLYQTPGGHLENGESIVACGVRETREETGLEIKNIRFSSLTNVTHFPPHHYVMIGLVADWSSGEAQVLEKDKCHEWTWYDPGALPEPLTPGTAGLIESYRNNKNLFDSK